jgi:hypothetical protein
VEIGLLEVGPAEVGPAEVGAAEVGPAEESPAEVGLLTAPGSMPYLALTEPPAPARPPARKYCPSDDEVVPSSQIAARARVIIRSCPGWWSVR